MSLLRKAVLACVALIEPPVHEFKLSRSVEEVTPIFNKDGVKIRSLKTKKVVFDSIPTDVWENKGISADLFRLDYQIDEGRNVSEFKGAFIGLDLDESARLGDDFISSVNKYVAESKANDVKEKDVEPSDN